MYYLGIDWGKSLCGIAIADNENKVASCYGEFSTDMCLQKLSEMKEEFEVEKVVVGITNSQGNKFSSNSKLIDEFVEKIKKNGFEVELEEEFFTTQMAQRNISEFRKKGISKKDNAESARLILQGWLDRK